MLDEHVYYATRVEDLRDDGIVLAMPMSRAIPVYLREGELFEGKMIKDGTLYAFQSRLLARVMNPLPVWRVSEPEQIKKIQLRSFVRLDINLPVTFWRMDENKNRLAASKQTAVTRNISAGGLLLASPVKLELGAELSLRLSGDKDMVLDVAARVVRAAPEFGEGGADCYLTGLQYLDMEERARRRIIQFINAKQIERRQRGIF